MFPDYNFDWSAVALREVTKWLDVGRFHPNQPALYGRCLVKTAKGSVFKRPKSAFQLALVFSANQYDAMMDSLEGPPTRPLDIVDFALMGPSERHKAKSRPVSAPTLDSSFKSPSSPSRSNTLFPDSNDCDDLSDDYSVPSLTSLIRSRSRTDSITPPPPVNRKRALEVSQSLTISLFIAHLFTCLFCSTIFQ